MSRKSREKRQINKLNRIANVKGFAWHEGRDVIVIEPRNEYSDHMAFDRQICALGILEFFRPVLRSETLQQESEIPQWILVKEVGRGEYGSMRTRMPINLHEMALEALHD